MHRLLLSLATLALLAGCPRNTQGVGTQSSALKNTAPVCSFEGPFKGKLKGTPLSEESMELDAAKARCLELGEKCAGITSDWEKEFPFYPMEAKEKVADASVQGATYIRVCK